MFANPSSSLALKPPFAIVKTLLRIKASRCEMIMKAMIRRFSHGVLKEGKSNLLDIPVLEQIADLMAGKPRRRWERLTDESHLVTR